MHSSFWWNYNIENLLFYGYNISSVIYFVLTCIGFVGVSFLFKFIEMWHAKVRQTRIMMNQRQLRSICPSESDTLLTNNPEPGISNAGGSQQPLIITRKDKIIYFVSDMGLWLSQNILGYILMLTVMLYNGYLIIAIVIGSAIGIFLFDPTLAKIKIENCRAMRATFCTTNCVEPDKTALIETNPDENRLSQTSPVCHNPREIISEAIVEVNS